MEQMCPYCGSRLSYEDQCVVCQREVAWVKKCYLKSDFYYIKAYEAAKLRRLTTAEQFLKKAIIYNKYNIQARNLLGLIYYEVGQVGLGLKSWILSQALQKEDNIASLYIEEVQKDPNLLEDYKESTNLYNKALKYLNQGNEDVAAIRLKKAVSVSPHLVEGRVLLALCYIKAKQFKKANEQLREALKIDHAHGQSLTYLSEISEGEDESEQSYEFEYGERKGQGQVETKMPLLERKSLLLRYSIYFVLGVLCMWITESCLVTPTRLREYKKQMTSLQNEKEKADTAMNTLKSENEKALKELKSENDKLKSANASYEEDMGKKNQQEKLAQSEELLRQGDYAAAAQDIYNIEARYLTEEGQARYEEVKQEAYSVASNRLCNEGYNLLQNESWIEARTDLETALLYEPSETDKRRILYYLGCVEKGLGDSVKAKKYFDEVIKGYPETSEAMWAQQRKSEINN